MEDRKDTRTGIVRCSAALLTAGVVFAAMLFLTHLIPLFADDYWFSFRFDRPDRVASLIDLARSQWRFYFAWSGRTVAHVLVQAFLMHQSVFRLLNPLVFTGIVYLAWAIWRDERAAGRAPAWLGISGAFFALWWGIPRFGETTLWLTGSLNYLWPAFFVFVFLWLVQRSLRAVEPRWRDAWLLGLSGLVAGWGFETTSLTGAFLVGVLLLLHRVECGRTPPRRVLFGSVAYGVGYALLVLAPGNRSRAAVIHAGSPFAAHALAKNLPRLIGVHLLMIALVLSVLIVGVLYLRRGERTQRRSWLSLALILAAVANNGLMLFAPSFPMRAGFGSAVYLACALLIFLEGLWPVYRRWILGLWVGLALAFGVTYWSDAGRYLRMHRVYLRREALLVAAQRRGDRSVELPRLGEAWNENTRVFVRDIREVPEFWTNRHMARYYGVDRVAVVQPGFAAFSGATELAVGPADLGIGNPLRVVKIASADRNTYLYFCFDHPFQPKQSRFDLRVQSRGTALWRRVALRLPVGSYARHLLDDRDFCSVSRQAGGQTVVWAVLPGRPEIDGFLFSVYGSSRVVRYVRGSSGVGRLTVGGRADGFP